MLKSGVQVLDRTCDILECLANHGPELGLSEITDDLGLSKSTVHRLLRALELRAYVRRIPVTSKYGLGTKLVELGFKASNTDGLVTHAGRYLTRLVAETGETVHLGVLRDGVVVSLSAVESPKTLRTPSNVGEWTGAHSSSIGKCLLADLDSDELALFLSSRELTSFTTNTISTEKELARELAKVRRQGFAVDDEEHEYGLLCIGAPIFDQTGRVKAALSIAGPANRLGPRVMTERLGAVKRAATELSVELGYSPEETRAKGVEGMWR